MVFTGLIFHFFKMEDGINLKIERSAAEFWNDLSIGVLLDPPISFGLTVPLRCGYRYTGTLSNAAS